MNTQLYFLMILLGGSSLQALEIVTESSSIQMSTNRIASDVNSIESFVQSPCILYHPVREMHFVPIQEKQLSSEFLYSIYGYYVNGEISFSLFPFFLQLYSECQSIKDFKKRKLTSKKLILIMACCHITSHNNKQILCNSQHEIRSEIFTTLEEFLSVSKKARKQEKNCESIFLQAQEMAYAGLHNVSFPLSSDYQNSFDNDYKFNYRYQELFPILRSKLNITEF